MELPNVEQMKDGWKEKKNPFNKARNERDETLLKFLYQINKQRDEIGMNRLPFVVVKIKLQHLDDWDLKMFYEECNNSINFSRCFFGKLKTNR